MVMPEHPWPKGTHCIVTHRQVGDIRYKVHSVGRCQDPDRGQWYYQLEYADKPESGVVAGITDTHLIWRFNAEAEYDKLRRLDP